MTDTPVQTRFEVAPGADLAANPATWVWRDESDRLAKRHAVVVPAGKQDQQAEMTAASTQLLLRNGDGRWTPRNPMSTLYPYVDVGMPARLITVAGTPHLTLTGTFGARASTGDHASLDITGDFSGVIECVPHRMPSSIEAMNVAGKWVSAGNFSWRTDITHFGLFRLQWSVDGTAILEALSTAPIPRPDTMSAWGWHIDVANGANRVITFYWAFTAAEILANPAAHILGQPVTQSGNTSIFNSNSAVEIGDLSGSSFPGFFGMVKSFQLRSGDLSTGSIVTNPDFSAATEGSTTVVDSTGKTYALTDATIDRRHIRLCGETNTVTALFPEEGVAAGNRARVPISGPLRRLGQGAKPLKSALTRKITAPRNTAAVTAYWPLEDDRDSTQVSSPIAGVPAGTTTMDLASVDTLLASKPLPSVAGGTAFGWSFDVDRIGATDNWQYTGLYFMETFATGNPGTLLQDIRTAGSSAAARNWALYTSSTDGIRVVLFATDGTQTLNTTFAYNADMADVWFILALNITQDGADIDWDVDLIPLAGPSAGLVFGTSGTVLGATAGRVTRLAVNHTAPADGLAAGHFVISTDKTSGWLAPADSAYVNERAANRFRRLCDEEGIPVTLIGDGADSAPMGPQRALTLPALLKECVTADLGMMGEQRYTPGLTYRTRASLYNQAVRLTIPNGGLTNPFEASLDDQTIHNDVEVSRPFGSSDRRVDQPHIDSHGLYDDSVIVNVATDSQLAEQAGWRLHQGTWPESRYPSLTAKLRGKPNAYLDQCLFFGLGDRFQAPYPPVGLPPDPIDQIAEGWRETLESFQWNTELVSSPAGVWSVGVVEDEVLGRVDTDGSELHIAVTNVDTSFDVAVIDGPMWTADNGEFPFEAKLGGEVVDVTDIAASLVTFGSAGTAAHANNANVTPGLPASTAQGNLLLCLAGIRNSGAGVPNTPTGYTRLPVFDTADNVQLFAKVAGAGEAAPTITFTGGVANADTSAQMARLGGNWHDAANVLCGSSSRAQLNDSAQNIAYPPVEVAEDNCIILYLGWKQDDWTSVAAIGGATEIGEPSTTTGDDQSLVWDYVIQTTRANIAAGSFVVTGGAAAVSRGAVVALRSDRQVWTVTRSVNGVQKAHAAGTSISLAAPMVAAL